MLDFGWQVSTTDASDAGRVSGAMYDWMTKALRGVVVRRGVLTTRDISVPIEHVSSIEDGLVSLSITSEELEGLEDYRVHRYVSPDTGEEAGPGGDQAVAYEGPAPSAMEGGDPTNPWTVSLTPFAEAEESRLVEGSVGITQGQDVVSEDGRLLGQVTHLVYDGDRLTGVIVRPPEVFGAGKIVGVDRIATLALDQLTLSLGAEAFEDLPEAPAS